MSTLAVRSASARSASPRAVSRTLSRRRAARLLALLALIQAPLPGQSTYEWSGTVSTVFADSANWSPASTPSSLDTARFAATPGSTTVNFFSTTLLYALDFTAAASSHTFNGNGNVLVLGAGGLTHASASTQTISAVVSLGSTQTWATTGTGLTDFTGGIFINSGLTLTLDGSGDTTLSSQIFGNGALAKTGTGLLTLAGNNSHAGGTTFAGGTTQLGSASALGTTGPLAFTGGTLRFTAANTTDYSARFSTAANQSWLLDTNAQNVTLNSALSSSGGTLTKLGTGTLTLNNFGSYDGLTTVSAGTLQANSPGSLGTGEILVESAATLDTASNGLDLARLQPASTGTVTTTGALTYSAATDHTVSATLDGTGATLQKSGPATLTLTGANTHTGGTQINGGTLSVAADSALGDASAPLSLNAGTLATTATLTSTRTVSLGSTGGTLAPAAATTLTLNGNLSASGPLTVSGPGTLALGGTNFLGSGLTLAAGTTQLDSAAALGNSGPISFTGGTLRHSAANTTDYSARFSTAPGQAYALDTNGQNVTLSSALISSGATLTKTGPGTLTLFADNTYSGLTTLAEGQLHLGSGGGAGSLSGPVSLASGTTLAVNRTADLTLPGDLSGAGGLTLLSANTLTLTGDTTYTGPTHLSAGTLALDRSTPATLSGPLSGSGGFTKLGSGTLTLSGSHTLSGPTTVSAGSLHIVGGDGSNTPADFSSPVSIAPGADLTFINPEILRVTAPISGTGTLHLSGTRDIRLTAANPFSGPTTVAATAGLVIGNFGTTGSLAGPITLLGNAALNFNRTDNHTHSGNIGGVGRVFQEGPGNLTLSGALTYTGLTIVNGGTLTLASPLASPLAYITNDATLAFSATQTYAGLIANRVPGDTRAHLRVVNNANLTLTAANTYLGTTTVTGGSTLTLGANHTLLSATPLTLDSGATLDLATFTQELATLTGPGSVTGTSGTLRLGSGDTTSTFTGTFTNAAALEKIGTGTLTLSGPSTHSGNTTVSAGTLATAAANTLSPNSSLTLASGATLALDNHAQTVPSLSGAGTITLGSATLTTGGNHASTTYSGTISGPGGLNKTGTGTLTLSAANPLTGTTTIAGGTVLLPTTGSVAGPLAIGPSGTLGIVRNGLAPFANPLSGSGTLNFFGPGALLLTGTNSFTGTVNITGGGLQIGAVNQLGAPGDTGTFAASQVNTALNTTFAFDRSTATTWAGNLTGSGTFFKINGGTLTLTGTTFSQSGGTQHLGGTLDFAPATSATLTGPLSGSGALVKSGPGTLTLSGSNTLTGPTTVSAGTLATAATGALSSSSALTVASGATLALNNFSQSLGALSGAGTVTFNNATLSVGAANLDSTFSGNFTGGVSTTFTKLGTGQLTLSGTNSAAAYTLSGGRLVLDSAAALGSTGTITLGGTTLVASPTNTTDYSARFSPSASAQYRLDTAGQNVTWASNLGSGGGTLVKSGLGDLTLTSINFFTGSTTLAGGTLTVGSANALSATSSISFEGGTLRHSAANALDYSARFSTTPGQAYSLDTPGGNITWATALGSSGSTLTKLGTATLTLSANSPALTGLTTVAGGTLLLGENSAAGSVAGPIAIASGATLAVARTTDLTLSQPISGSGSLAKSSTGVLFLTGNNTFTGTTTIITGAIQVGAVSQLGAPGDTGTFTGDVVTSPGTTFAFDRSTATTWAGNLSGPGTFFKIGAGTLTLTGPSFAPGGGTALVGGTLDFASSAPTVVSGTFGGAGALRKSGTGTLNYTGTLLAQTGGFAIDSGTLDLNPSASSTVSTALSGSGGLRKLGTNTSTLSGSNTFTGDITLTGGNLALGSPTALGSGGTLHFAGGTLLHSAANTTDYSARLSTAPGQAYAINTGGQSITWATGLATPGSTLVKHGTGVLFLTGDNTFSSPVSITGSGLQVGGSTATATGSLHADVVVNAGTTFGFNRSNDHTHSAAISGAGDFYNFSPGNLTLTGPLTHTGTTFLLGTGTTTFDRGATNYTYASPLSGSGPLQKLGSGTLTLSANSSLTGPTTVSAGHLRIGAGGTLGSSPIALATGTTVTLDRSDSFTFANPLSGSGSLIQAGTGTTTLTGASTHTGGTTVTGGTLRLGNGGSLASPVTTGFGATFGIHRSDTSTFASSVTGSGAFAHSGTGTTALTGSVTSTGGTSITAGTLQLGAFDTSGTLSGPIAIASGASFAVARSDTFALANALSGAGRLIQRGPGLLTLTGTNTHSGGTVLAGGTTEFSSLSEFGSGSVTLAGGALRFVPGNTADASLRLAPLPAGSHVLDFQTNDVTFATAVSGTGGLAKSGSGTLTFTADHTYTGTTTVSQGTLRLGDGGTTGSVSGPLALASGSTLQVNRSADTTLGSTLSGTGTLEKLGTNTITLASPNPAFTGTTAVSAGTLRLTGTGQLSGNVTVASGTTFDLQRTGLYALGTSLSGAGTLTHTGTGAALITGALTHTGGTTIHSGGIQIGAVSQLGAPGDTGSITGDVHLAAPSTTFAFDRNTDLAWDGNLTGDGTFFKVGPNTLSLTGTTFSHTGGTVLVAGALDFASSANTTVSTAISGGGSLFKSGSGTLTLSADNFYTGGTTVTTGQLRLGAGGTTGGLAGSVALSGAGSSLVFDRTTGLTHSGVISGQGSVTKLGTATLALASANTYTGTTTVSAGTLRLVGTGTLSGPVTIASGTTLDLQRTGLYALGTSLSGAGTLTHTGTGAALITGALTHTGGTTIHSGGIQIGAVSQLGAPGDTGSITGDVHLAAPSTTFAFDRNTDLAWGGNLTGSGTFFKVGPNTLSLTGTTFSHTGGTVLVAGALDFASSANTTVSTAISGGGSLFKSGSGTLTLSADNFYTGGTTVSAGTLRLVGTGTLSGPVTIASGTTLDLQRSGLYAFSPNLSGAGALTHTGAGAALLTGALTHTGGTTIHSGGLQIGAVSQFGAPGDSGSITGDVHLAAPGTSIAFDRTTDLAWDGNLTGSGTLFKIGPNTLTLTGTTFSHTGGTVLGGGTLDFASASSATVTGPISGAGGLFKSGPGTLTLAADNTYTGGTTVSDGQLRLGAGGTTGGLAGPIALSGASSSLVFDRTTDLTHSGVISGQGSVTKLGTNTLTLTADHTYTGTTTLTGGTLQLGDGGTTGSVLGPITAAPGTTIAINRSDAFTFSLPAASPAAFAQRGTGTTTFTTDQTYTGGTTVESGTLRLGAGGNAGFVIGNIAVQSGATLAIDRSDDVTFSFDISGAGTLAKLGANTFTATGALTHTGGTQISGGTFAYDIGSASRQLDGPISGPGGFTLLGTGNLLLTAPSTYSGPTDIPSGTIEVNAPNLLSPASTYNLTYSPSGSGLVIGANHAQTLGGLSGSGRVLSFSAAPLFVGANNESTFFYGDLLVGSLTKQGTGTLFLGVSQPFLGATAVEGGTLELNSNVALGVPGHGLYLTGGTLDLGTTTQHIGPFLFANATVTNGTLSFTSSPSFGPGLVGAVITGNVGATITGPGTTTLTANNTYLGGTSVATGATLRIGNGGTTGNLAGSLQSGLAPLGGHLIFDRSDSFTYAGNINGFADLTKRGPGTLTLTGNALSGYDTPFTIQAGTLALAPTNSLQFAYNLAGPGHLVKNGPGTVTLTGQNTFTGQVTVNTGTLRIGTGPLLDATFDNSAHIASGATLTFGRTNAATYPGTLTGTGNVFKFGSSALTLTGDSSAFSGGTQVYTGALQTGTGGTTGSLGGSVFIDTGTSYAIHRSDNTSFANFLNGPGTFYKLGTNTLTYTGEFYSPGATVIEGGTLRFASSQQLNIPGPLSGPGNVIISGFHHLRLEADQTYTGTTTLQGGTVTLGNNGPTGSLASSAILFDGPAPTLEFTRTTDHTYAGDITTTTPGTGRIFKYGPGTLTLTGTSFTQGVTFINGGTLAFTGLSTITGNVSGSGALRIKGDHLFTGNVGHTGGTTIAADSTLQIGNGGATGSLSGDVALAASTSTLTLNNGEELLYPGLVSGPGQLVKQGTGLLAFATDHTFTGTTTVNGGTLLLGLGGTTGSVAGPLVLAPGTTLAIARSDAFTLGQTTGLHHLDKYSGGTLTLAPATTTAGNTRVYDGALALTAPGQLAATGALVVDDLTTVQLAGHDQTIGGLSGSGTVALGSATLTVNRTDGDAPGSFTGAITGTGGLVKTGPESLFLSGSLGYTGLTQIQQGTLRLAQTGSELVATSFNIAPSSGLEFHVNGEQRTYSGNLTGAGQVTHVLTGINPTLTLTGNNTHTGDTYLEGTGTLIAGSATALSQNTFYNLSDDSTLDLNGHALTLGKLEGEGALRLHGATFTLDAQLDDSDYEGTVTGPGTFVKTGANTLYLSGDFTAPTLTVQQGTVSIGYGNESGTLAATTTVSLAANTTLRFDREDDSDTAATITGTGSIQKINTRLLTLDGLSPLTGPTLVSEGELRVNGTLAASALTVFSTATLSGTGTVGSTTIQSGGTLSPGASPGLLTINGDLTLDPGSTTLIELGGTNRGFTYDAINISNSVLLGGTLDVVFWAGWTPTGASEFRLFNATSIGGSFTNVNLPALPSDLVWETSNLTTSGTLGLAAIPEPASYVALAGLATLGLASTRRRRR